MESDTSDDEDWTDTATASRRKKLSTKVTPASSNGKALTEDHVQDKSERTPKRNTSQNKVENTRDTPLEGSRKSSCSDKKPGSSTYKRLGDAVVQVMVLYRYLLNFAGKLIYSPYFTSTKSQISIFFSLPEKKGSRISNYILSLGVTGCM